MTQKFTGILLVGGKMHKKAVRFLSVESENWTRLEDLPNEGRRLGGSVAMNDGIYFVAGVKNKNIDKYYPSTGVFETVGRTHEYVSSFGICKYDSKNLIFAGGNVGWGLEVNTTYIYNTETNTLKRVGDLSAPRDGLALVRSENGDIYAIGGHNRKRFFNTIEKFDKDTQAWNVIEAELVLPRCYFKAVAYKSFIYIIGGRLQDKTVTDTIEKFDTKTREVKIIEAKLKEARDDYAIAKIDNDVAVIGGCKINNSHNETYSPLNSVEVINLHSEKLYDRKSQIDEADCGFTANVV